MLCKDGKPPEAQARVTWRNDAHDAVAGGFPVDGPSTPAPLAETRRLMAQASRDVQTCGSSQGPPVGTWFIATRQA